MIFTKIILLTIQSHPTTLDECRTYAVTSTSTIGCPCTHSSSVFSKGICNTANSLCSVNIQFVISACIAVHSERCATVDIVIAFVCTHILPALYELAIYRVVQRTIHFNNASTCSSNIVTRYTNKLCIRDSIVVTGCFNNSTKVYNRLTSLTVGTTGVACLSTSCCLVFKSNKFCIVNVVRRRNCCEFGCNVDGTCEGILTVENTVNNVNIDVYNRFVTFYRHILIRYIVVTIPSPNANRNAYESIVESLAAYAVSFNSYGKDFGNFVVFEGSLEAVCNDRAFGFPSVRVVQLKLCNQLVYICEIRNVDINVVDRLSLRSFAGVIMTAKLNNSITSNCKCASDLHGITKLILNFKCNGMNTCTKSNVALSGKHIAVDRRLNYYTVNGDLTGSKVKSCVISNSCGECNVVTVDNLAVIERNSNVGGGIGRIGNGRKNSVVNSRAVVESNIIDVECNYISGIGFYISTNERRRTAVRLVRRRHRRHIVVLADIDGSINPTRFGNICIGCRVQVRLLAGCGRSEHKVFLLTRCLSVNCPVCIDIELRLERKTLTVRRERIFGNIQPHTKSCCLLSVCNVTENDYIVSVKENVIRPGSESCIGIVQSPRQCIVTVSYSTAIGGRRNKGITAEVFVELTCERSRANERVVYTVVLRPLLCFFEAHEACLVAVLEVPNNLGTLTEFDCIGENDVTVGNGYVNACDGFVISGGKLEAVKSTSRGI